MSDFEMTGGTDIKKMKGVEKNISLTGKKLQKKKLRKGMKKKSKSTKPALVKETMEASGDAANVKNLRMYHQYPETKKKAKEGMQKSRIKSELSIGEMIKRMK